MDDDEDKGRKKNTDRDFKPDHAQRKDHSPRGAQGRPAAGIAEPGLGTSSRGRILDQTVNEPAKSQDAVGNEAETSPQGGSTSGQQEPTPERYYDPANDPRPVFKETGDKEVDDHFKKTHRMISKDDPGRGVSNEGSSVSQNELEQSGPAATEPFFETGDREVDQHYAQTSEMMANPDLSLDRPRMDEDEAKKAFERAQGETRGLEQGKGRSGRERD